MNPSSELAALKSEAATAGSDSSSAPTVLLVSGMSGAGRSTAAHALEDLGYYVVDNLPPALLSEVVDLVGNRPDTKLAVVIDARSRDFFESIRDTMVDLAERGVSVDVLFLEANDETLVRRYESNRRSHPLRDSQGILDGVTRERAMLADLRGAADLVIDTSTLNVHDLRRKLEAAYGPAPEDVRLRATVMSFGFKYGIPVDADLVVDMRFLPNPYWNPELSALTGLDAPVSDFVTEQPDARDFLDQYAGLLNMMADGYIREGKRYVTIAVGCTGGKHRSVAMAEHLSSRLVKDGVDTYVVHRDLGRE